MNRFLVAILALFLVGASLQAAPVRRLSQGELHIPCILLEFRDVPMTVPEAANFFDRMLNEEGFDQDDATGSVRDYFLDNSLGEFVPVFDVYGPVTLDKYRAWYGRDVLVDGVRADAAADYALYEACLQLDEQVDFSQYDADEDGVLDFILYIYAGHDQSQGASTEAIWAHQWFFSRSTRPELLDVTLDGLKLDSYCCASELWDKEGTQPAGIGIICHEIGHCLGLPDLYDTHASGREKTADASVYSLMCNGATNNQGHTPPFLTAEERSILGWLDLETLPQWQPGWQELPPIRISSAYVSPTGTDGEYFLYEFRDGQSWDAPLPTGLVVYHVDRSERLVGDIPAAQRWENWQDNTGVNAVQEHPCFYILPSSSPAVPGNLVYPGLTQNYAFEPLDWEGDSANLQLCSITLTDGQLSVFVQSDCQANINGFVTDAQGNPLPETILELEDLEACSTLSAADGYYRIDLPEEPGNMLTLRVSREGYRPQRIDLSLDGGRLLSLPVTLRKDGEADNASLSKYDKHSSQGYFSQPGIGAVRFTPEDLAPYVGEILTQVSFYPYLLKGFQGDIWVTVDIGSRRVLTQKLEVPAFGLYFRNTLDISEAGIVIPEGEDVYIGYGSDSTGEGTFYVGTVYPAADANSYYSPFNAEQSAWKPMVVERAGIAMNVALSAVVSEYAGVEDLSQMGYRYIAPLQGEWRAGDRFEPVLTGQEEEGEAPSVKWYWDGEQSTEASMVLEEGIHVVEARLSWSDGRTEVIRKTLEVR